MIIGSSSMSSGNTGEKGLPAGFRFHPTDEELVSSYLAPKVLDNSFSGIAIAEADLNKCEPWDLPGKAKMGEKEWYFFSLRDRKYPTGLRTNRATEAGYWKATGKDREVFNARTSNLIGMKKTLVFYKGRAPKGEKTNWVMHEYRLEGQFSYHQLSKNAKDEWVVCRIFHKSSGGKKTLPGLINGNFYIDECLGSHLLPALLESPSYTNRAVQDEETELSDIADIHLSNNNNILQNDPPFNLNTRTANSMSCIFSGSFPGTISPQMGLQSNPILMALAEQYTFGELNLKQCKMEPSSSGANDNSLKISHAEQWNMGQTRHDQQQQQQQKINVENNGISHTQSMETHCINPVQDHTAMFLNPEQMNPAMFNRMTRSFQLDPSAEAAPTLDLDSFWPF